MEIHINKTFSVSVDDIVKQMTPEELVEFIDYFAQKLDKDFHARREAAEAFADGLSEMGCRFLSEVIACHVQRNKKFTER